MFKVKIITIRLIFYLQLVLNPHKRLGEAYPPYSTPGPDGFLTRIRLLIYNILHKKID